MKHRLTRSADADIESALRQTLTLFGAHQVRRYATLINTAIERVSTDPYGAGCVDRGELSIGLRSLHLETAARRRGSASHVLYFTILANAEGEDEIVIVRLLYDRMEPKSRVGRALREVHPQ